MDLLVHMSESEAVFLLTTFANMAGSRDSKESEFIEAVTLEMYEVSELRIALIRLLFINQKSYTFFGCFRNYSWDLFSTTSRRNMKKSNGRDLAFLRCLA